MTLRFLNHGGCYAICVTEHRVLDVAMLRLWFQRWITFAAQVIFRSAIVGVKS